MFLILLSLFIQLQAEELGGEPAIIPDVPAPELTRVEDVNRDGLPDLIVGHLAYESLSVYLQSSKREFTRVQTIQFKELNPNAFVMNVELSDIDGDQILDLIAFDDKELVYFYKGLGDGQFHGGKVYPLGPSSSQLGMTYKGKLTIASAKIFNGNLGLEQLSYDAENEHGFSSKKTLLNIKKQLKAEGLPISGVELDEIVAGEFDGDGIPDLAMVSLGHHFVVLLRGKSDGSFSFLQILKTLAGPTTPVCLDIDRDGIDELIVGHYKNASSVIFRKTEGVFKLQQTISTGRYPTGFNIYGEGEERKLVALNYFTGELIYFKSFKQKYVQRLPEKKIKLAIRGMFLNVLDLDLDGLIDFVVSDFRGHQLSLLYSQNQTDH